MTDETAAPVLVRVEDGVGRLTLNRPRALNALDLEMVRLLSAALDAWEHDPDVVVVLLDGAGDRGLCAGGDVRGLAANVGGGRHEDAALFFREEYALDARIAEYPKPVVALADGITMGGGIGLAGHAALRVVTERSRLAMPETRIGFTPDVGGSWLLAGSPGRLGEYLGLTGAVMDAADAVYAGFADIVVPVAALGDLASALAGDGDADERLARASALAQHPEPSRLATGRPWIDEAFSAETLDGIVARLRAIASDDAREADVRHVAGSTADLLGELSPTGLAVTLAAVRRARELPGLRAALDQEYGLVMWFAQTQPDLPEGIRAQVIDKDRSPRWQPATIAELDPHVADLALAHTPATPLWP